MFKKYEGKQMIKINEIKKTQETVDFLEDLKGCLSKHGVTMIYGEHHIEFNREEQCNFAQCYIMNGSSVVR
jgi:hypothetical protein